MGKGRTNAGGGYDVSGVTATAADVSKAKYFINSSGELLQGEIDLASATAVAADVAKGKYFINKNGALVQGTINLAGADATVGNVRSGKKFINSSGELKTGTLADYSGSYNVTPTTSAQTLQTQGKYMTSNVIIAGTSGGISEKTSSQNGDGTTTVARTPAAAFTIPIYKTNEVYISPANDKALVARGVNPMDYINIPERFRGKYRAKTYGVTKTTNSSTTFESVTITPTNDDFSIKAENYKPVPLETVNRTYIDSVEISE